MRPTTSTPTIQPTTSSPNFKPSIRPITATPKSRTQHNPSQFATDNFVADFRANHCSTEQQSDLGGVYVAFNSCGRKRTLSGWFWNFPPSCLTIRLEIFPTAQDYHSISWMISLGTELWGPSRECGSVMTPPQPSRLFPSLLLAR